GAANYLRPVTAFLTFLAADLTAPPTFLAVFFIAEPIFVDRFLPDDLLLFLRDLVLVAITSALQMVSISSDSQPKLSTSRTGTGGPGGENGRNILIAPRRRRPACRPLPGGSPCCARPGARGRKSGSAPGGTGAPWPAGTPPVPGPGRPRRASGGPRAGGP